jgi:hypothetical protein
MSITKKSISVSINIIQVNDINNIDDESIITTKTCSDTSVSANIISHLSSKNVGVVNIDCGNDVWKISTCENSGSIITINSENDVDYCADTDDNIECNAYQIGPCAKCSSTSVIRLLSAKFVEKDPPPIIQSIYLESTSSSDVKATLSLSSQGDVYCNAYNNDIVPGSTSEIILTGYKAIVSNENIAIITINNLIPVTSYSIYCLTISIANVEMSYNDMISTFSSYSYLITTQCCKSIYVDIDSFTGLEDIDTIDAVSITVSDSPSYSIMLSLSMYKEELNSNDGIIEAIVGNDVIFPSSLNYNTFTSIDETQKLAILGNSPGSYRINVLISGSSSSEFEVVLRK